MKIFTHFVVDLDAVCSVWAAKQFISGAKGATVEFRPANWDGKEMAEGDLALDIDAGGRGMKGEKGENGIVHSCVALIVAEYASPADQSARVAGDTRHDRPQRRSARASGDALT